MRRCIRTCVLIVRITRDPDNLTDLADAVSRILLQCQRRSQVSLADLNIRARERFIYEYDMGDSWLHDIVLEQMLPADLRKTYPVCTAGAGDCPPEDCGGPGDYQDLVESRSSFAAYAHAHEDVLLVAQRILVFYEGGLRPTVDDLELMDALDCIRDRQDAAPITFDRRAINTALRHMSKEIR